MIYAYVLRYLLLNTWAWILVAVTWHHSVAGAFRPIILRLLLNPSHSALGSAAASLVARAPEDWGPLAILWTKEKCLLKVVFFSRKGSNSGLCIYPGLACNGRNAPCTNACNQVCSQHKPLRLGTSFRTSLYSGGQDRWRPGCTTSPGERGRRPSYPAHG